MSPHVEFEDALACAQSLMELKLEADEVFGGGVWRSV